MFRSFFEDKSVYKTEDSNLLVKLHIYGHFQKEKPDFATVDATITKFNERGIEKQVIVGTDDEHPLPFAKALALFETLGTTCRNYGHEPTFEEIKETFGNEIDKATEHFADAGKSSRT